MLEKIVKYLVVFSAIVLLLAGFASYINPYTFWIPAFLGLSYPFILLFNFLIIIVVLVFIEDKKICLAPLIAIFLTGSSFSSVFMLSSPNRTEDDIAIMTWNVKNFDLYNWSENTETREHMLVLLEEKKPDILCLQEFYTETKGVFKNIKEIKKRLGYKYVHFEETYSIQKGKKKWGLATFSKFPIKGKGIINFEQETKLNACIYTDIAYQKDSIVRVYNMHLQSIHFGNDDYKYLSDLKDEHKADMKGSLRIVKKLKNGFIKRASQVNLIQKHILDYKEKYIVCGDFNDTSTSYAYRILAQGKKDAFKEKGSGFGKTWLNPSPFFRIDFVLCDPAISVNDYSTISKRYSDHFPVLVQLDL